MPAPYAWLTNVSNAEFKPYNADYPKNDILILAKPTPDIISLLLSIPIKIIFIMSCSLMMKLQNIDGTANLKMFYMQSYTESNS